MLGISSANSALLMLIGQFADGISTTLLGLVADKLGNIKILRSPSPIMRIINLTVLRRKYGKRKSLHVVGSVCVFLSFPFVFLPSPSGLPPSTQMLYYSVFIVVFQFGWACVQISHLALITDLTSKTPSYPSFHL